MTEKHSPLLPCPFCDMPMTLQGDYTEETAWNFWCHADRDAPEVSTCILKDHQINTMRDMQMPDHNEAVAWNTRAVNSLPEAIAALEATKGRIMNAKMDLALKTKNACGVALAEAICEIDAALTKLKG